MRWTTVRLVSAVAVVSASMWGVTLAADKTYDSSAGPLQVEVVTEGLHHPWSMAFLPDGRMLVTERSGQLRVIDNGVAGEPISGVPEVRVGGQAGLFDVRLAPDFAQSGRLYLAYAKPNEDKAALAVSSAKLTLEGDTGALSEVKEILDVGQKGGPGGLQYGGRIVIAPDGNLLITSGDHGIRDRAQAFGDLAGGVIRIAPDGSVPADNPKPEGWAPELFSKGERNPQGAALRPSDGVLFTVEHGAMGGDEFNKIEAGKNYGWPTITYGINYNGDKIGEGTAKEGLEQPVYYWDPSIAPSGLIFYQGDLFPAWKGDPILGALKYQMIVHLEMEGDKVVKEERLLEKGFGRIRDIREGPDGALYLATDEDNGRILKVTPAK